jgi:hypothetical protein
VCGVNALEANQRAIREGRDLPNAVSRCDALQVACGEQRVP